MEIMKILNGIFHVNCILSFLLSYVSSHIKSGKENLNISVYSREKGEIKLIGYYRLSLKESLLN